MAKLHELLAVSSNLKGQAEATRTDLKNTFEKKQHLFRESLVTFKSTKDGLEDKTESQSSLQSKVMDELTWISEKLAKAIDVENQIDHANTKAKADVILEDGTVILKDLPATQLLQLEKRVKEIQELVAAIPTLDPAKAFVPDPDRGEGVYRAKDVDKPKTEKVFDFVVMYPHSDKHPAQIKELMLDKVIGHSHAQEWCSMITVADKGRMLDRAEDLARAVKRALSRANDMDVEVAENKIGMKVVDYVFTAKS